MFSRFLSLFFSRGNTDLATVPSLGGGGGGQEGRAPQTTACAPHFGLLRNVFETSRNDKTTDNNGKRRNNVQT